MIEAASILTARIKPGDNDRTEFDAVKLDELAKSIRRNGLAQPITVRPLQTLDEYEFEIVAGERRFRAVTEILGWAEIDAIVRDYGDRQAADVMLTENLARADLDPIDEARAYEKRVAAGQTVEEVAEIAGVQPSRVRWRMDLLRLREEALTLLMGGNLSVGLAWEISQLDRNRQAMVLHALATDDLTNSQATALCRKLLADQAQDGFFDPDDFMQVEEWVAEVKTRSLGKAGLRALVIELAEALERADGDASLVARARAAISE